MTERTRRPSGLSDKQRDWILRMIDAADLAGNGRAALDTLTHHGGQIDIDRKGQRHINGLTGGWGGTASLAIEDLKDKNYRPATRPAAARRTNGAVDTAKGATRPGGHTATRERSTTSPAGDRFRANAPSADEFTPTAEQNVIVDLFKTGDSLKIFAGAGAGKTSTLKLCAKATPARRGLFVAFNKMIVQAADASFPRRLPEGGGVEARTMHSLAYRATPTVFTKERMKRSARVHPDKIAQRLKIDPIAVTVPNGDGTQKRRVLAAGFLASLVMAAIERFCQSDDEAPAKKHFGRVEGLDHDGEWENHNVIAGTLERHLTPVWEDLCDPDGWAPYKPSHYLKQWALTHPVIPHDYLLVDEAQDLSAVMRGFVKDQLDAGKQVVCVGDSWQEINSWMGAVNALEQLPIEASATLTKSFRFGPEIAALANRILTHLGTDFRIEGNEEVASTVGRSTIPARLTLSRTNALAVRGYMDDLATGGRPCLVGNVDDIIWFCQYARILQIGERRQSIEQRTGAVAVASDVKADLETELADLDGEWDREDLDGVRPHPELACFLTWEDVRLFVAEHEDGREIKLLVSLVEAFGAMAIVRALKNMQPEAQATHVYSTAHKMKGREEERVELAEDFADEIEALEPDEAKLLYVAVTRAKLHLDPSRVGCLEGLWGASEGSAAA